MPVLVVAWRNVWRNPRRTGVTVAAMSLALLVMILYAGLMQGFLCDMERDVLDLEVGDLQVSTDEFRDDPSLYARIERPEALLEPLAQAGYPAAPRLLAWGMAAAGEASAGVSFRGIDVARDATVSRIGEEVAQGSWLADDDPKGVVLGRRLARTLSVSPGAELLVLSQGADGAMAYDLFQVRGVLRGVGDVTDRTAVFLTAPTFRELFVVPRGAHQIIVRRPASVELSAAAASVRQLAGPLEVRTWRDLLPTLASMMDSARGVMVVMFLLVYLMIGILILNAMLMAVFERLRELGVLKALGVGPFDVLRLILAESALQTGLAIVIGGTLAVPALLYLARTGIDLGELAGVSVMGVAMNPIWRAAIAPRVFTEPLAVLLGVVGLAVIYPALKAAWIQPVEAIHHR